MLTGDVASPAFHPVQARFIYLCGARDATVVDRTHIRYLAGGLLNSSGRLDSNGADAQNVRCREDCALPGGLCARAAVQRDPPADPQTGPLHASLQPAIAAALDRTELTGNGQVQWSVPEQTLRAVSRELFVPPTDNVVWTDPCQVTDRRQMAYAQDIILERLVPCRYPTMALAVHNVVVA